jgi:glycosyltransferase involved in cell wall biosynthesis
MAGVKDTHVAYIVARFPKVTETFILYEVLELLRQGFPVTVYPLIRERTAVKHPGVDEVEKAVRFQPFFSLAVLKANWHYLLRRPLAYLRLLAKVIRATIGSRRLFLGALGTFPKSVWLAHDMERRGVAHVHAHFATHSTLAALVVKKLASIPFSFTAHGSDLHVDQRSLAWKLEEAAFAVMVSEYNRDFVLDRCSRDFAGRLRVIHCGVDPEVFRPPSKRDHEVFQVLCVAAFREVKGHTHLVEACRILTQRGLKFRLELVGNGPLMGAVKRQVINSGLEDVVEFHGALARPQVLDLLRSADAAVLPSILDRAGRREGIPVSLMEAMACGLPVVSSRLSGIPELVEDGRSGFLVAPGDSRGVADALEKLCRSRELREAMGAAGRQKVLDEFNLKRNAARLAELLAAPGRTSA